MDGMTNTEYSGWEAPSRELLLACPECAVVRPRKSEGWLLDPGSSEEQAKELEPRVP
jgi:hypothetical protein